MSRMAQDLAKQVKELQNASKTGRRPRVVEGAKVNDDTQDISHDDANATADTPQSADAPQQEQTMAEDKKKDTKKKTSAPKAKSEKKAAAPKPAAAKGEKKPRKGKLAAEGEITGVEATGETYLELKFTTGSMRLTPTSNRQHNRDLVVKAIKALLK